MIDGFDGATVRASKVVSEVTSENQSFAKAIPIRVRSSKMISSRSTPSSGNSGLL